MTRKPDATVAVRALAEFVHRRGDIRVQFSERTRSEEGIVGQRRYQQTLQSDDAGYETERRIETAYVHERLAGESSHVDDGFVLAVTGRIDGVRIGRPDARWALVEEIKTTRVDVASLHDHTGNVHMAQAKLYAAMLCQAETLCGCLVRVTYVHPDSHVTRHYDERCDLDQLRLFLTDTCRTYVDWLQAVRQRQIRRNRFLQPLSFPYPEFRQDQRRIAGHAYRALRDADHLLMDAPTGTGKTIATLFPAVKAVGEGELDRVVFATSRTTGQRAAEMTLDHLRGGPHLSSATITAKERTCFNPGTPCDPAVCEFARGYYDRVGPARDQLLDAGINDRDAIETVARAHCVCPFELALDTASWADVIVCDYNYVFDPIVNFKRISNTEFGRVGLLVDEAHQLGDRVSDCLSTSIARRTLKAALGDAPEPVARRIRSVDRSLMQLGRDQLPGDGEAVVQKRPDAVFRALERLAETLFETPSDDTDAMRDLGYAAFRMLAGRDWFRDDSFEFFLRRRAPALELEMRCLKPAFHIREVLDGYNGAVRFSGTLAPTDLYQRIHGCEGMAVRSQPPFADDQLGVFVVPDVPTYFRQRRATAQRVAQVITSVAQAGGCADGSSNQRRGNHLVAFPSFDYLRLVLDAGDFSDAVAVQSRDMSLEQRDAFVSKLNDPGFGGLGFVVMGGLFSESIDYSGDALCGVIIVGAGIPPPSIEREAIAESEDNGFEMAYLRPAMTRVVQAAGRVVRGERDRGVVVLVDPRFTNAAYQAYFPTHWRPKTVGSGAVGSAASDFWSRRGVANGAVSNGAASNLSTTTAEAAKTPAEAAKTPAEAVKTIAGAAKPAEDAEEGPI